MRIGGDTALSAGAETISATLTIDDDARVPRWLNVLKPGSAHRAVVQVGPERRGSAVRQFLVSQATRSTSGGEPGYPARQRPESIGDVGNNQRAKIVMSDDEIAEFIERSRTATMATVLPNGRPHLVAMWYAVLDGEIWFETKAKSQKAVNLRRDPTITVMIEDGQTYDTLRGVSIDGQAEIIDDPDTNLRVGISVWERYTGPYTDEMRPFVDQMMNNRICVRVVPSRMRSWDHRKLGTPGMPLSGSTAQYLS